jgi:hypothetical protein
LSHCWGSKLPLHTTKGNIRQREASIDWDDIPIVYRETIELARQLDVRYVWIDSLCIVQDDVDDWQQESAKMHHIYENAYLTVAATSSADCSESMIRYHQDAIAVLEGSTQYGTHFSWLVLARETYHPNLDTDWYMSGWPLLHRAWVLQERILSSRVLHVSRGELIWECKEETVCECGKMRPYGKNKDLHLVLDGKDSLLIQQAWRELVQVYSVLRLTKSSDKLPALAGLAQAFKKQRPGDRYLAGLWERSIIEDFLWYTVQTSRWPHPQDLDRAPSWSWVTLNTKVCFATDSAKEPVDYSTVNFTELHAQLPIECHAEVLSVTVEHKNNHQVGEVEGGRLVLKGRLLTLDLENDALIVSGLNSEIATFWLAELKSFSSRAFFPDDQTLPIPPSPSPLLDNRPLVCMPIARVRKGNGDRSWEYAMVLQHVLEGSDNYRRIGMLQLMRSDFEYDFDIGPSTRPTPSFFDGAAGEQSIITIL